MNEEAVGGTPTATGNCNHFTASNVKSLINKLVKKISTGIIIT